MDVQKIKHINILSLLNGKYLLTEDRIEKDAFELVHNSSVYISRLDFYKSVNIYENKEVLPRAFIVRNAKIIEDKNEI